MGQDAEKMKRNQKSYKTLKCPFYYCPLCGGKFVEDVCDECHITALKAVKRYIRFYNLFTLGEYEQDSNG